MPQQLAPSSGADPKPKPRTSSRVSSALKSGVVYGGSAVLTAVNNITPHIAGAVDILVIEQPDGSRKATPFYVRFGKYTALRTGERDVKLYVNDELAPFGMHIGMYGQAYFAEAAEVTGADDDDQEALLAGIMSPPSGYSSGADDAGHGHEPNETGETLRAVRQRVHGIKESRQRGTASRRATGTTYGPIGSEGGQLRSEGPPLPSLGSAGDASGDHQVHGRGCSLQPLQLPPAPSLPDANESFLTAREGSVIMQLPPPVGPPPQQQQPQPHLSASGRSTQRLQMVVGLTGADRNESFLSARETLAAAMTDDEVAGAIAAAFAGGPGAADGTIDDEGTAVAAAAAGCSTSPDSLTGAAGRSEGADGSVGACPSGWSEDGDVDEDDEERHAETLRQRQRHHSSGELLPDLHGSYGDADGGGASGSSGCIPASSPSPAVTHPLSPPPQQHLPPALTSAFQHPAAYATHHGAPQQPLHQQLGFPENRPAAAAAPGRATPPDPSDDLDAAAATTSAIGDAARGMAAAGAAQAASARREAGDAPEGPRRMALQPTVDWEQVLAPQGRSAVTSGSGASPAECVNGTLAAGSTSATGGGGNPRTEAMDVGKGARTGLTSPLGSDPLPTHGSHGSGSLHAVSLLSSSLRASCGSRGGSHGGGGGGSGTLAAAAAEPLGSHSVHESSLGWLRAKTATAPLQLPAAAERCPAPAAPAAARSGAAAAGAAPDKPGQEPEAGRDGCGGCVGAIASAAVAGRCPPSRCVALLLHVTTEGGVRAQLQPLSPPTDLPPARPAAASQSGEAPTSSLPPPAPAADAQDAPGRLEGRRGSAPAPLLTTASVPSENRYWGDAAAPSRGLGGSAALPVPTHNHNHSHNLNGYTGRDNRPHPHPHPTHRDLHSTSAPLPAWGMKSAAASGASAGSAAAATATAATARSPPGQCLELSLCASQLALQMPYAEAAALFDAARVSEEVFLVQGLALISRPDLVVRFHDGTICPWQPLSCSLVGLLAFGTWRIAPDTPCWSPPGATGAPPTAAAAAAAAALLAALAQGLGAAARDECARDGGPAVASSSANTTPKKGTAALGGGSSWRLWMFGGRREAGRTSTTGTVAVTGIAGSANGSGGGGGGGARSPPLSSPLAERQSSLERSSVGGSGTVVAVAAAAAATVVSVQHPPAASEGLAGDGAGAGQLASGGGAAAATTAAGAAATATVTVSSSRSRGRGEGHVVTKKSLTPTPEQLASLPLKHGQNTIVYKIGARELKAYVYFLPWKTKIVISDIDGTITKSDVLGHLLPAMGWDWSHPGIAELLTNIRHNNYLIMYLSSRSISQANITRDFINTLVQGEHRMPLGPVIISPHGLLPSLYREMILRRPHEFKIATLQDIRALFPPFWNPFYGGFGNRDTDEISYREVGVQPERIFIINPRGELRQPLDVQAVAPAATARSRDASAASVAGSASGSVSNSGPTSTSFLSSKDPSVRSGAAEERASPTGEGAAEAPSPLADAGASGPVRDASGRTVTGLSAKGRSVSGSTAPNALSSWSAINDLVHDIFPPLRDGEPVTECGEAGGPAVGGGGGGEDGDEGEDASRRGSGSGRGSGRSSLSSVIEGDGAEEDAGPSGDSSNCGGEGRKTWREASGRREQVKAEAVEAEVEGVGVPPAATPRRACSPRGSDLPPSAEQGSAGTEAQVVSEPQQEEEEEEEAEAFKLDDAAKATVPQPQPEHGLVSSAGGNGVKEKAAGLLLTDGPTGHLPLVLPTSGLTANGCCEVPGEAQGGFGDGGDTEAEGLPGVPGVAGLAAAAAVGGAVATAVPLPA